VNGELQIRHYVAPTGKDVFDDWFARLKDPVAQARIAVRLDRLAARNFGDCKPLRGGVWELRIDWGPGYRIYYAIPESSVLLILSGGDKRTQTRDIQRAQEYWGNYKERMRRA
jgi:putative addiction module killer protein